MLDSIPERDLSTKRDFGMPAFSSTVWKTHLQEAASLSQLSVLLHVLELHVDWDYSLAQKVGIAYLTVVWNRYFSGFLRLMIFLASIKILLAL